MNQDQWKNKNAVIERNRLCVGNCTPIPCYGVFYFETYFRARSENSFIEKSTKSKLLERQALRPENLSETFVRCAYLFDLIELVLKMPRLFV